MRYAATERAGRRRTWPDTRTATGHAARRSRKRRPSPRVLTARGEEILHHVLTETVRHGPKYAPAVPPRDLVDESCQPFVIGQHEDIHRRPAPGHLVDLGQGELEGFRRGRPVEPEPPVAAQVRRGLAVGNHHDHRAV